MTNGNAADTFRIFSPRAQALSRKGRRDRWRRALDLCAVLLPKQEEPVIGKDTISEYYKKLVADPQFVPFTLTLSWNSFHLVGDIAIATAMFEGDVTRNGKQIHFRGKNLLAWKKQADGSWKIFRYMFDEIPAKK